MQAARNRLKENLMKRRARTARARTVARYKATALPKIPGIFLAANYVNPITLNFPKGHIVFEIRNRMTGRTDYYDRTTFFTLMKMLKNEYDLMMMNPKIPSPGARNPVTRGPIYPRNVRRVTVKPKPKTPSPNSAARKIQSVVRKHLSKKRAAAKPKTPSPKKTKSKTRSK